MIYVFEDYELDMRLYELRYAGKRVKLEPQVFNILVYLIQHRDRVVTKQELLDTLWPDQFISEATLTHRLMQARKAVGDTGRIQAVIQTVHGRGYRFITEVEERAPEVSSRVTHPLSSYSSEPAKQLGKHTDQELAFGLPLQPAERVQQARSDSLLQEDAPLDVPRVSGAIPAVGRKVELGQLHRWLQQALDGTRQVVFVTGEAGVGKTTVVEAFVEEIGGYGALWIGRGQCIEYYGVGEAYRPVLEALGRLCREPEGQEFIALLARQAPTWLAQMPWLLSPTDFETLQRQTIGATRERMLREMAEAMEVLTAKQPLILILEDLHWSDYATLDLVTLLARRREPARLLLLGTYRPEATKASGHPLQTVVQTLQLHRHCVELPLSLLSTVDVETYLMARFRNASLAATLSPMLYRLTEGNPLFMVNIVEHWVAQGWLYQQAGQWVIRTGWEEMEREIPATLREVVAQRRAGLSQTEQKVLEVASVAGTGFSAASVATGLAAEVVETETWCEGLAQHGQFIQSNGVDTWPDGTVATRYRFLHVLYQNVLYEQVPAARRVQLHQRIAAREEAGYGERCGEIAARLAMHFERGQNLSKAIRYHHQAAQQAIQVSGYQEAITHLSRGLEMLQQLPQSPERTEQELSLQMLLGPVLMATKGFAASDVEYTYARARELCQQVGETPQLFSTLWGLWQFTHGRAQMQTARELGEQLLTIAQQSCDPVLLLQAHHALWSTLFHSGELIAAYKHTEHGLALYNPQQYRAHTILYGVDDPGVCCRTFGAKALWFLGYPDQAVRRNDEALALAQELEHPFSLAYAHIDTAATYQLRRDVQRTLKHAEAALALGIDHGFLWLSGIGTILQGWALAMQHQAEGIAQIREGLAAIRATGTEHLQPWFCSVLAAAYSKVSRTDEGLSTLAEALEIVDATDERLFEAELYRLKGELLLRQRAKGERGKEEKGTETEGGEQHVANSLSYVSCLTPHAETIAEVEVCFHHALTIARRQQAKSWELRAAMSLSWLWQQQGKRHAAHQLLAEIYGWFTEGFDTADLQEAKALLEELA